MDVVKKVLDVMGFTDEVEENNIVPEQAIERNTTERNVNIEKRQEAYIAPRNNTVSIMRPKELTLVNGNQGNNVKVVLQEPRTFNESQRIADNLLDKKAVIINLEACDAEIAAKIIDFVGGVIYAVNGSIQKISQGIIVAAPANIDVVSELKQQLSDEQTEVFSWVTRYHKKGDF